MKAVLWDLVKDEWLRQRKGLSLWLKPEYWIRNSEKGKQSYFFIKPMFGLKLRYQKKDKMVLYTIFYWNKLINRDYYINLQKSIKNTCIDMETNLKSIQSKTYEIRAQRVILDFDLSELYGTESKAVKRDLKRFPSDFMFELSL